MKKGGDTIGMAINTVPSKLSIDAAASGILKILGSCQEQETIRKALDVFGGCVEANPVTIQGCSITQEAPTNE